MTTDDQEECFDDEDDVQDGEYEDGEYEDDEYEDDGNSRTEKSFEDLNISDAVSFSISKWCESNHAFDLDKDALVKYYTSHDETSQINADINELKKSFACIEKLYEKYEKKAGSNIKQLNRIYGKRIDYEASRLSELSDKINELGGMVDDAKNEITGNISETFDLIGDVENEVSNFYEDIQNLSDRCNYIQETLDSIVQKLADLNKK